MVDYTKPEMRDETWRRWKGGQKLADELRLFYTSKSALERLALRNPASTGLPAANGERPGKITRLFRRRPGMSTNEINRLVARRRASMRGDKPRP